MVYGIWYMVLRLAVHVQSADAPLRARAMMHLPPPTILPFQIFSNVCPQCGRAHGDSSSDAFIARERCARCGRLHCAACLIPHDLEWWCQQCDEYTSTHCVACGVGRSSLVMMICVECGTCDDPVCNACAHWRSADDWVWVRQCSICVQVWDEDSSTDASDSDDSDESR